MPKNSSSDTCYFCCDSIAYLGILKLYSEYNALNAIIDDLRQDYFLVDNLYLECRKSLNDAVNRLESTNSERDKLLSENLELKNNKIELEKQKRNWKIFGAGTSIALIGVILLLF